AVFPAEYPESHFSGITSFRFPHLPMTEMFQRLSERGIYASFRNNFIRIAPHFFTPMQTLYRFLNILDEILGEI
ncbi:MAG: hypothetical protein ACK4G3_04805, partial [bacterium]